MSVCPVLHMCVVCFILSMKPLGTGPCGEVDELQKLCQEVRSSRPDDSDVAGSLPHGCVNKRFSAGGQEEGSPTPPCSFGALALLVWSSWWWLSPCTRSPGLGHPVCLLSISGVHCQAPRPGRGQPLAFRRPFPCLHAPPSCLSCQNFQGWLPSPSGRRPPDCWLTASPLLSSCFVFPVLATPAVMLPPSFPCKSYHHDCCPCLLAPWAPGRRLGVVFSPAILGILLALCLLQVSCRCRDPS